LLLVLFFFVGIPTFTCIEKWWQIRSLLSQAKSVKLIHYNPYSHMGTTEIVYGTKDIPSEDFSKISAAFAPFLDIGFPGSQVKCFDPHHKIVITDSTGHETIIRICLHCGNMVIGEHGELFGIPEMWQIRLRGFFDAEGLPYTPDRYMEDFRKARQESLQ
jgi:hypothetical protein